MTTTKTVLLNDADTTAYLCSVRIHEDGTPYSLEEVHEAIDSQLNWLKTTCFAHEVINILSDREDNFRLEVYPDYKGNRKELVRPIHLDAAKDYIEARHKALVWPRLEADDVQGILATSGGPDHYIVVSIDKDLKQIPGDHFNPKKPELGIFTVEPEAGLLWMWEQTLTGDPVDGYKGIPKVGPVKAKAIIAEGLAKGFTPEGLWPHILEAFLSKGLTKEYALSQLRCARILQAPDWDVIAEEVNLYVPQGYQE